MFPLAVECFESIIAKSMDNIRPAGIDVYAYKAYQRKAQMYFDALCFQTAYECLSKAEFIIRDLYEKENATQSRQMLEHRKIVAKYFRKFQKFDKALEILMDVYQIERKIYTQIVDEAEQIEDVFKTEVEEQKESTQEDQDQEKSHPKIVEITEEVKEEYAIDESTEDSDIDDDDMSKDISIRLGQTIIQIMEIHAFKNNLKKGLTYRDIAEKYILAATKDDKKNGYYIKFLQASGNMYMRSQNSKDLEKAYELYDEANSLLEEVVGKKNIGEVYLYQKDHHKAEAFLGF